MQVYVAGPMRGIAEFNFPLFNSTAAGLRELGHTVFNPAEHDTNSGFRADGMDGTEDLSLLGFDLRSALCADLTFICQEADAVCVLPGWQRSRGAQAEVATAAALGLKIGTLEDFESDSLSLALAMVPHSF